MQKKELPKDYRLLTLEEEPDYPLALGRVTNGNVINTSDEHMEKFYGCPYVLGVDIFPIDRIYNDSKKENDRKRRGQEILDVTTRI